MIRLHVNAVFSVYDGFTGRPMPKSAVRVLVDGQPIRPEYRDGGYVVLSGLDPGEHEITLSASHYSDETIQLTAGKAQLLERVINLKPGRAYPFGTETTQLHASVLKGGKSAPGEKIYIGVVSAFEIKIAQELAKAGESQMKLYIRNPAALSLPGEYLIADGKDSEVCTLEAIEGDFGNLSSPLSLDHKRGKHLLPCQSYVSDDSGKFTAFFRQPVEINIFTETGSGLINSKLNNGGNDIEIKC